MRNCNTLKCYREAALLSQVKLAELVGVSSHTILLLENSSYNSSISLLTALKIKKLVGCPLSVLLNDQQLTELKELVC